MNADDLGRILDELGRRLGPAGEHVFALAVRQQYLDALTAAFVLIGYVELTIVLGRRLERWRTAPDADDMNGRDIVLLPVAIVWGLIGLAALIFAVANVPEVLNPEYAAIRDILRSLR